jgi:hypothetical protein
MDVGSVPFRLPRSYDTAHLHPPPQPTKNKTKQRKANEVRDEQHACLWVGLWPEREMSGKP